MSRGAVPAAGLLAAMAMALAAVPRPATAQEPEPFLPLTAEARLDVITARTTAVQGGLGLGVPVGNYVRLAGLAAAGPEFGVGDGTGGGSETRLGARADFVARFALDPFRESRWAPYAAAGTSMRYLDGSRVDGSRLRGYLLAALGIEGPPVRGWLPAVELGIGGGTRVGAVLRRGRHGRR